MMNLMHKNGLSCPIAIQWNSYLFDVLNLDNNNSLPTGKLHREKL